MTTSDTTPGVRRLPPNCVMARSVTTWPPTRSRTIRSEYRPFCTHRMVASAGSSGATGAIAAAVSFTLVVTSTNDPGATVSSLVVAFTA